MGEFNTPSVKNACYAFEVTALKGYGGSLWCYARKEKAKSLREDLLKHDKLSASVQLRMPRTRQSVANAELLDWGPPIKN